MTETLTFHRLYSDENGQSHFGDISIDVVPKDFAPPARPFAVSDLCPASQHGFLKLPAGWVGEMHPSPIHMWVFFLSGEMEFEASDGERRIFRPGAALLLEDTSGEGHKSRVTGESIAVLAAVRLP